MSKFEIIMIIFTAMTFVVSLFSVVVAIVVGLK